MVSEDQAAALVYLRSQIDMGKGHDSQCDWRERSRLANLGESTAWSLSGCRRCAAWRTLGFKSPRDVL